MERAAKACYRWLIQNQFHNNPVKIFCGKGNNGGDGLAIAGMLIESKCVVSIYILETGQAVSGDFENNLVRLHSKTKDIHFIQSEEDLPQINRNDLIIDA